MSAAPEPFLLLQISDTHLGAGWQGVDPERCLRQAVEAILALPQGPDALLVSGDLTQDGTAEEYARVRELLAPLDLEPHVLPGNHDLRGPLREAFGVPGAGEEPVSHAVDLGPLRLICVDSIVPGAEGGSLDGGRIEWLDAMLAADGETPTVVAMHHPPLSTEMPGFDRIGLDPASRAALGEVLTRHPQVRRVVAGHVHRVIVGELAGRPVLTVPSTYLQSAPDFASPRIEMRPDPPGFAIHALRDGALASHLQQFAPPLDLGRG
ncbi:MAG TPA: phosphodiesterase [Solirubrobacterales bacterium]|nr:phosphodiesterase [Solirubrobacterales bacterium]